MGAWIVVVVMVLFFGACFATLELLSLWLDWKERRDEEEEEQEKE